MRRVTLVLVSSFLLFSCGKTGLDKCKDGEKGVIYMETGIGGGGPQNAQVDDALSENEARLALTAAKICWATEGEATTTAFKEKAASNAKFEKKDACDDGYKACLEDTDRGGKGHTGWVFFYDDDMVKDNKAECDKRDTCTWIDEDTK